MKVHLKMAFLICFSILFYFFFVIIVFCQSGAPYFFFLLVKCYKQLCQRHQIAQVEKLPIKKNVCLEASA